MPSASVIEALPHLISLNSTQAVGIPIALIGAVFLSLGAQFQHRGVAKVEAQARARPKGLGSREVFALFTRPSWVIGTVMLGLAIVLQLTSLRFAPLIVVQPLGAIALVTTALLNARVTRTRLNRRTIRAILICVGGIAVFVTVAAFTATDASITDKDLTVILILLAVVVAVFGIAFQRLRGRLPPIALIIGAGVQYGFVATMAKVVINRILQAQFDWLTALGILGLLAAGGFGMYLVQSAYSVGPPDLVIAGLTVVDPLVAVSIGIVVLHEAAGAPAWAPVVYVLMGAVAVFGVFQLARYHPALQH